MKRRLLLTFLLLVAARAMTIAQTSGGSMQLASGDARLEWSRQADGWHIRSVDVAGKPLGQPSGAYTLLYINRHAAGNLVDMDLEGTDFTFYAGEGVRQPDGSLVFRGACRVGELEARWAADPAYPGDFHVRVTVTAWQKGSFAISTPTLTAIDSRNDLDWGMIPGNWYGHEVQKDFTLATHYSQGVPAIPYLAKERNTMTLCPLVTTREKVTLAVIPDPGTAQDPWEKDVNTRQGNKLAMSLMNRHDQLTPTAYSPVLGQKGSFLSPGDKVSFSFRYSLRATDWWPVFEHAVLDIYRLADMLQIQKNYWSLSQRVGLMRDYLHDDKRSHWKTWKVDGYEIGANGTKNADVGAMLMMARTGRDSALSAHIPYVRNYKLVTQEMKPGFFQGAAMGEYADQDGVAAERGNYVEPLFTTYYTLMDMGNLLLYDPHDTLLRERVRLAADKLLAWQHPDGGTDVAYDRWSHQLTFPELKDLRPTWYGLLIAYRLLGDQRYLEAARKGADWLIREGVDKGYYLGVCGDARNIWDFATAQCSEALLELYDATKEDRYRQAAIASARAYATSIFTHPIATRTMKSVNGVPREDWEINQAGLSVEHIRGTAGSGPILISSFTGLYVRMFSLTRDSLFLYMARVAANGRNAYMDSTSGQTIYYWSVLDKVKQMVSIFPHHAYWQVGWITDYLVSEASLRSGGQVRFPYGFMTPKVGPHVSYGFAPGVVFGDSAGLIMPEGLLKADNPALEYLTALSVKRDKLYVILMNQSPEEQSGVFTLDAGAAAPGGKATWIGESVLQGDVQDVRRKGGTFRVKLPAWGMAVLCVRLRHAGVAGTGATVGSGIVAAREKFVHGPNVVMKGGVSQAGTSDSIEECRVRNGLPHVCARLRSDKPVTIVYFGGSITQAGGGWREQSAKWLQDRYPKAVIKAVNAGVGGTGSDLGAFRTGRDVLAFRPDLVFVEFAVNDGGMQPQRIHATMEGIVRQIKRADPTTDICFVYTLSGQFLSRMEEGKLWPSMLAMEDVAEYYGIPSVQMGTEVVKMAKSGTLVFQGKIEDHPGKMVFSPDNVHPYATTGHRLYTEALARSWEKMAAAGEDGGGPGGQALPLPYTADNWENATMLPLSEVARTGTWLDGYTGDDSVSRQFASVFPGLMRSDGTGATFRLHFDGTLAGVYDIVGPGTGVYAVVTDGGPAVSYPRFDKYATYYRSHYFLLPQLAPGEHTIEWRVSDAPLDKAAILRAGGRTIEDSRRYAGRACYAGWLLVLGKPFKDTSAHTVALAADWPQSAQAVARYRLPVDTLVRAKMGKWQDLKFGLFMHWGTYSEWGIVESWSLSPEDYAFTSRKGPYAGDYFAYKKAYEGLQTTFNPVRFDPVKWAAAAKAGGMRYVVFTAKHHDGFCMFDTKLTDYRVTSPHTPYSSNPRSNITGEVFDAFRKEGFMVGAYFSKPDWHSDDYWWRYFPPKDRHPNYDIAKYPTRWKAFTDFTYGQLKELMTDYGRVDLLWLDGDWVKLDMAPVARMARAQQPGLIMVDRNGAPEYMNYLTPEQKIPAHYMPVPWESCITMGNSWSYDPQEKYKPVRRLVQMLVDVVAKNGNLLLDVGPSPEGEWSDTVYRRLAGIGDWLKVNGASIYSTRPLAPYRRGPWAYTQGNDAVYATYLPAMGEDKLSVHISLPAVMVAARAKVRLLGEGKVLKWRRAGDTVDVQVPDDVRDRTAGQPAWVFKISL